MRIFTVDIDQLEAQRAALRQELDKTEALLDIAVKFGAPQKAIDIQRKYDLTPATPSAQIEAVNQEMGIPAVNGAQKHRRHGYKQGLRKQVILVLNTGPAREEEIAKTLAWTARETRSVVQPMLKYKLCFLNENGYMQLSTEGRVMAQWFAKHPERVMYHP